MQGKEIGDVILIDSTVARQDTPAVRGASGGSVSDQGSCALVAEIQSFQLEK